MVQVYKSLTSTRKYEPLIVRKSNKNVGIVNEQHDAASLNVN